MCGVLVLASRLTSTTPKITHLPSGETCGSPTRLSFIMSSKVKGCLACAKAGSMNVRRARSAKRTRRMMNLLGKRESVAGLAAQVRSAAVGSAAATGGFSQRRGLLVTDSAESEDALG